MDSIATAFSKITSADDPATIKRGFENFEEAKTVAHLMANRHYKKAELHTQIGKTFGEISTLMAMLARQCSKAKAPTEDDYDESDMQALRDGARALTEFEEVVK